MRGEREGAVGVCVQCSVREGAAERARAGPSLSSSLFATLLLPLRPIMPDDYGYPASPAYAAGSKSYEPFR